MHSAPLRMVPLLTALALGGCAKRPPAADAAEAPAPGAPSLFTRPWVWHDEHGEAVSFGKWQGTPLVLSAIYTSCPSVCPRTIEKLRALDSAYQRNKRAVAFVLVTLDPHTDTPARLLSFKESRHLPERWHLLSGTDTETQELSRMLHLRAVFDSSHIVHDSRIAVFDEQGRLARSYRGWAFQDDEAIGE